MPGKSLPALNLCHRDSYSCENVGEGNERTGGALAEGECDEQESWEPAGAFSLRIAGSGSWRVQTAGFTLWYRSSMVLEHFECHTSRRDVFQETKTSTGCCFACV